MNGFFNKLIFGLGMIAIGVLYMLNQLGWMTFDLGNFLSTYWPTIIIYFGLRGLFIHNKHSWGGSFIWSLFVIFLGTYFLLNNLGVDGLSYENMYKFIVPVLLILFGVNVLFKGPRQKRKAEDWWGQEYVDSKIRKHERKAMKQQMRNEFRAMKEEGRTDYSGLGEQIREESKTYYDEVYNKANHDWKKGSQDYRHNGKISRSSFIGDVFFGEDDWDLAPLDVSLFIGDTVIDLTKANIPMGETKINVSSFIGDLKVFIPNDMQVEVCVIASAFISDMKVLDRYESGLFKNLQTQTRDYGDADKKIKIVVSTFIGDVIIKRVG
ncbi:MAG: hypothetical protein JWM44_2738 [Bacilli bacterium]|nr:hypothetical protein [Bacilli bacterium]